MESSLCWSVTESHVRDAEHLLWSSAPTPGALGFSNVPRTLLRAVKYIYSVSLSILSNLGQLNS